MRKSILGFLLMVFTMCNLLAQETEGNSKAETVTISTDRPSQCFSSSTVPKGRLLLETGIGANIFFGHGINYKHGTYGLGICWMPPKKNA